MAPNPLETFPPAVQDALTALLDGASVETLGNSIRLEKQGLVMDLDDLGEGEEGDYDPDDPEDTPYLRFSFYGRQQDRVEEENDRAGQGPEEEDLIELSDSSYCTLVDSRLDLATRIACAAIMFGQVYAATGPHPDPEVVTVKRACERASSMSSGQLVTVGEAGGRFVAAMQHASLEDALPGADDSRRKAGPRM